MPQQQIVIQADEESHGSANGMPEIGPRCRVVEQLAHFNTGPDHEGGDVLYGPGFEIELAPGQDPLTQMLMTIVDDDIAWVVIMKLAREFRWKLLDPVSGRELRPR